MDKFTELESEVRSYCRAFPVVFSKANGSYLYSEDGVRFIDFLAGAGSMNFGHNNEEILSAVVDYLGSGSILHGLDFHTVAKRNFIEAFETHILKPKNLPYKLQFCGPTGSNAVEAALKLAKKATGRNTIFSFVGGFHGVTAGSLAVTGNKYNRGDYVGNIAGINFMPYPAGDYLNFNSLEYIQTVISDPNSGIEKPAAIILETVQGEGGVNIAPLDWLQKIRDYCTQEGIVLICDEIQSGIYRTGTYFSFERAGIQPDIVTLSKSLSGIGLPLSLVLVKPEYDLWTPGEHNGTFRGNQLAFVSATQALKVANELKMEDLVKVREKIVSGFLNHIKIAFTGVDVRGIGLMWGIDMKRYGPDLAKKVTTTCFDNGLILERSGRHDTVVRIMPPLTIPESILQDGLDIIFKAMSAVLLPETNASVEMVGME